MFIDLKKIFIVIQLQLSAFSPCLLILEREEGREKHRCERETSIGCLPYMPWLGIRPTTFWCTLWFSNQLSQLASARINLFLEVDSFSRLWQGFLRNRSKLTLIKIIPGGFTRRLPPCPSTLACALRQFPGERETAERRSDLPSSLNLPDLPIPHADDVINSPDYSFFLVPCMPLDPLRTLGAAGLAAQPMVPNAKWKCVAPCEKNWPSTSRGWQHSTEPSAGPFSVPVPVSRKKVQTSDRQNQNLLP